MFGFLNRAKPLGRQDSGTLESDMLFYTAQQFQVSESNATVLDLTTGPRSEPFDGFLRGVSLKPFLTDPVPLVRLRAGGTQLQRRPAMRSDTPAPPAPIVRSVT